VSTARKDFSYETFAVEHEGLKPEALLPKNLDIYWIDEILCSQLSDDQSAKEVARSIVTFACAVLLKEFGEELDELHLDLYLQELLLEKLERINTKAGVSNNGFAYIPAEVDDIFTGPHYSAEHIASLLKLVAGAIEWEKRWTEQQNPAA
jgi:hypothetical protein